MSIKKYWENEGQADANGKFTMCVENEETHEIQRFEGNSHLEVAENLAQAQANATVKIRELSGRQATVAAQPESRFAPRELSADDAFQLGHEIQNPETAAEAIRKLVESATGVPMEKISEMANKDEDKRRENLAITAAQAFQQETPEYFHCVPNAQKLVAYLRANRLDMTVKENYTVAFAQLQTDRLLVEKPAAAPAATTTIQPANVTEPSPARLASQPATVTTRPRGTISATMPRASDSSHAGPAPKAAPKYTPEDIQRMPQADLRWKIANEPGFAALLDGMTKPTAAQPVR